MSVLGVERGAGQPTTKPCVQRRHDVVLCARLWVQCGGEGTLWRSVGGVLWGGWGQS